MEAFLGKSSPVKDGNACKSVSLFTTFDASFDDDTSLDLLSLGLQKIHSDPNLYTFLKLCKIMKHLVRCLPRVALGLYATVKHYDEMIAIRKIHAEKKIMGIQHADVRNLLLQYCLMTVAACLKVSEENVITEVENHATRTVDNIGFSVYPGSVCSNVQNHGI